MSSRQQQVAEGTVERRRGRERLLFACALVIIVFSPADWLPPIGFSWAPLVIRLEWAAALVATALGLRRADARRTRGLLNLLAVATAALYAALVQQTGGAAEPAVSVERGDAGDRGAGRSGPRQRGRSPAERR